MCFPSILARKKTLVVRLLLLSLVGASPAPEKPYYHEIHLRQSTEASADGPADSTPSPTSSSTFSDASSNLVNSTASASSNSAKIDWSKVVPPFPEFSNSSDILAGRPDKEVFHLTQQNIDESDVLTWFAAWTMARQTDPLWEKKGAMGLFAWEFLNTGDYLCNLSTAKCNKEPSELDIQIWWPGPENRLLAQRIYLLTQMVSQLQSIKLAQLV